MSSQIYVTKGQKHFYYLICYKLNECVCMGGLINETCENKLYYNFNIYLRVCLLLKYKYEHIKHFKHEP